MTDSNRAPACRLLVSSAVLVSLGIGWSSAQSPSASEAIELGLRGVYFVPNAGQWSDADVFYGLHSRGLDVALRESSLTLHVSNGIIAADPDVEGAVADVPPPSMAEELTLTVTFPGSNAVEPLGVQPRSARFNYFVGGEGRGIASDVPSFGAVVYEDLYDGVDLHVMGNDDGVLKYEFHVAPGADYGQIRIAYDGIDSLCIDGGGDLHINTSFGILSDAAPMVWQDGDVDLMIPARFELVNDGTYRIALYAPVDQTRALVIDPEVEWMFYLGGSSGDEANDVVLNSLGETLVCGETQSVDFEGQTNSFLDRTDGFVVKTNTDGEIQWMTYLGGEDYDYCEGIAVDSNGNVYVTGRTNSPDFVGRNNSLHGHEFDSFVSRLSASGSVEWMTYVGGTEADYGLALVCTSDEEVLATGSTWSRDFEGRSNGSHGQEDIYVARVSAAGVLTWMAYYGGIDEDDARAITLDELGNIFLTGRTDSDDFEGRINTTYDSREAYVAKLSRVGEIDWMMYLRGDGPEQGEGIAVARDGEIYIGGSTSSNYFFEGRINEWIGSTDAFIARIHPDGVIAWVAFYGGTAPDWCYCMTLTDHGELLIAGTTLSPDFIGRSNGFHGFWQGAFVLRATRTGELISMEFLGGSNFSRAYGIAADRAGNAIVVGETWASDFEGRRNERHGGGVDAFVLKSSVTDLPRSVDLLVSASCPQGGPFSLSWSQATPLERIAVVYSLDQHRYIIPEGRPCAGTTLALKAPAIRLAYQGFSDASGSGEVHANVGRNACGGYLQLIDLSTCVTSNVERIE